MTSILVVDDEPVFIEALTISLEREGFGVIAAADGPAALKAISEKDPDLILLDVMLPGMSGIDVCREIRKSSSVPVIMVTAKGEEIDAVVGLEVGADDYITKPYRLRELIARIRAILRRSDNLPKEDEINNFVSVSPIQNYYTDRIKFKNVNGMSMKIHVASQRDLG